MGNAHLCGWGPTGTTRTEDQNSLWMRRWRCLVYHLVPLPCSRVTAETRPLSRAKGQMSPPGWDLMSFALFFQVSFHNWKTKTTGSELIEQNWLTRTNDLPQHVAKRPVDRHPDFLQKNVSCPFLKNIWQGFLSFQDYFISSDSKDNAYFKMFYYISWLIVPAN